MNKLTIIGNVTRDSESRVTQSGVNVCTFSVAVNGKKREEEPVFFKVTAWRKLAEICGQYVKKGMKVCVVGKIEAPKPYTNSKGETKCDLCVTADDIEFLSRADENTGSSNYDNNGYTPDQEPSYDQPQEHHDAQNGFTDVTGMLEDDSLPF